LLISESIVSNGKKKEFGHRAFENHMYLVRITLNCANVIFPYIGIDQSKIRILLFMYANTTMKPAAIALQSEGGWV
jgi:hypothetical protein